MVSVEGKRLECGFVPTVEERIVGRGAKGSSGAMWLFGSDGGGTGLYNHIHKVLSTFPQNFNCTGDKQTR